MLEIIQLSIGNTPERFHLLHSCPTGNELTGFLDTCCDRIGLAADINGSAGIQEHNIRLGPLGALKDSQGVGGIFFRGAALDV